jgi:hypothetical protein
MTRQKDQEHRRAKNDDKRH